jgi:hypothetical protein
MSKKIISISFIVFLMLSGHPYKRICLNGN